MGDEVGFANCVFEKLRSFENTIFLVLSANTAIAIKQLYVETIENLWNTVVCFWTWQKGVSVCFFFGF